MPQYRVVEGLLPPPSYSHVATPDPEDRLVFTAGAVPLDPSGNLVGDGDLAEQTRAVIANLETALKSSGSSLHHVLQTRVYVVATTRDDLSAVWNVVRSSDLSDGPHCSTIVGVSLLGYPGQLVEIEAVAVA